MGGNDDEAGSLRSKRFRQYETMEEVLLPQVYHELLLWEGSNKEAKSSCVKLNLMKKYSLLWRGLELLTSKNQFIWSYEFYSTYEFDEVCANDELQTKKIVKFRLGGRAHSLTLFEFAHRLGLYHAEELDEDGFDVYFQGGLRSDDHFNAQEYWTTGYDKIQKNDLWLLSMFDARHQNGYANVAWLIARTLWITTSNVLSNELGLIEFQGFKVGQKAIVNPSVKTEFAVLNFSCRDRLCRRVVIDLSLPSLYVISRLALLFTVIKVEDLERTPRASMQDLYERMGNMEIRQGAIERMSHR
ncbi:hypothetical protein Tco_0502940 [Tanacetum coccineum]